MDFVDEQDGFFLLLELLHHGFQALFKITTIPRTRQQSTHVERPDDGFVQDFRRFAVDNLLGQAFGNGRLAHARVADEDRIVLAAAAEHLDAAIDFHVTADQRVDLAGAGLLVEIHAIGVQRLVALLDGFLLGSFRPARARLTGHARLFRDAVRDEIDRVIAGHVLLLQEVGSVAFTLGEDGYEHVRAGHFVAAGAFNVKNGALHDTLECGSRLNAAFRFINGEAGKLFINVSTEVCAERFDVDLAGAHDFAGMLIFGQRQKQVFQCGVFMIAF